MLLVGDDAAPTELAGVAELQTESVEAWSLDDGEDDFPTQRFTPRRITAAALAASLVLIAAAGAVALLVIRGVLHLPSAPDPVVAAEPAPSATPTTTAFARPPVTGPWLTPTKPVTVTVQAPPKTIEAAQAPPAKHIFTAEELAPYDRQFVANIQASGWQIWDANLMTTRAHQVCFDLESGVSREEEAARLLNVADPQPMTPLMARQFTLIATATYPSCPP